MKLMNHQIQGLSRLSNFNRCAFYWDMGLGKTFVGSEKAIELGKNILIVCQKSKVKDWMDHFISNYNYRDTGMVARNLTSEEGIEWFFKNIKNGVYTVGIINYELVWRRKELEQLTDFTLILDESSLIQNETAKQTKFIINKLNPSNVVLLSGTPCSGKYENLWSQAKLLGWDVSKKLFDQMFVQYDWLRDSRGNKINNPVTGASIKIVVGYKNEEYMKEKFRQYGADFLKTEEVFELPKQTFINSYIEPIKKYKEFVKKSIVEIDDITLVGNTNLTKRLYQRMLCGQYNKDKLSALKDLISSANDRFIIFYNFNEELDKLKLICEELNKPFSQMNGQAKDLKAYEEESNSITLCQYQAASKGLNLQKANKIIYFTPTQSVENWMQSQKRIHRIGQDNPCFYYKLICKDSIEEKIYAALERGVDYTDALFEKDYAI